MEPEPLPIRFHRSARMWKHLAIGSFVLALVLTVLVIWLAVSLRNATESTGSVSIPTPTPRNPFSRCPGLPSLLALPLPMPKRIVDAIDAINDHLKSMATKIENKSAISINIFYHDSIIFTGHYGSRVYQGESAPDKDTIYRIGSVTKIFPVILLYKLYEDGVIASLDDPLVKYAPKFRIENPFTRSNITLRQIAGQMSGLPREAPCRYVCTNTSTSEQLKLLSKRSLVVEPWTQPSYSNLGYALLGRILTENLLNTTFEEWVEKEVLHPLRMKNTGFTITDRVEENMAPPYLENGTRMHFTKLGWLGPAGGMYSTIADLMKLVAMLANPGRKGAVEILTQETIREMLLPEFLTRNGLLLWGSPWEMRYGQNFLARQKGGTLDSYGAIVSVIPELHFAVNAVINNQFAFAGTGFSLRKTMNFIHETLVPVLNDTLFELQREATFPIDVKPFVGTFYATEIHVQIPTLAQKVIQYNISVEQKGDKLVANPSINPNSGFVASYIGHPLLFQAVQTRGLTGSCFGAHIGVYGMVRFEHPDSKGVSRGFTAPSWEITAKRVQ